MKAARLHRYDESIPKDSLKVEEIDEPRIENPLDVIVRIGAAGLCRTDIHVIEGQWQPIQDPDNRLLPYILGHPPAVRVYDERGPRRDVDPEFRPPLQVRLGFIRGRQVAYPHPYQLRRRATVREQRPAELLLPTNEGLTLEDATKLSKVGTLSLTRECAVEALPLVNPSVDLIGGVVVVEYYVSPPYAGNRQDGLPRVRDHQVGEVRSAEVGRQPQPSIYCFALYLEIRDEAQLRYGLIQLGVPDARKGAQNPCLVYRHVGRSAAGFSVTAGPVPACSTCSSSGTSMS